MKKKARNAVSSKRAAQLALELELELPSGHLELGRSRDTAPATRVVRSLEQPTTHPPIASAARVSAEPHGPRVARDVRQLGLDVGEKRGRHSWRDAAGRPADRCRWCGLRRVRSIWLASGVHAKGLFYLVTDGTLATAVRPSCAGIPLELELELEPVAGDERHDTASNPCLKRIDEPCSECRPVEAARTAVDAALPGFFPSSRSRGPAAAELAALERARARAAKGAK